MPLRRFSHDDPALINRLGDAHSRFQGLVDVAEPRARAFYEKTLGEPLGIEAVIDRIFADVEARGDEAVAEWGQRFDGSSVPSSELVVRQDELAAAYGRIAVDLREALETAAAEITTYQQQLMPTGFGSDGSQNLGVRWAPLDRVGAYVPGGSGGTVPLCSSVLMNLIPAKVAGVQDLVLATPSRADGTIADEILAAAHVAGVDTVFASGGIQAIAAMAIGTASLPKVDKIVGPGNLFVTLAKKRAFGHVDIDMLAGPSEVLVIADGSVDPAWAAADLLSQAEHDVVAMPILVAIGSDVADAIDVEIDRQLAELPDERRRVASTSVSEQGLAIIVPDRKAACMVSDRVAPEHLEILVENPQEILPDLRHAGAIFIGPWSPEPIGDYVAGPSHTLPTGGTARMWSGIGADTFLRRTSVINLDEAHFRRIAGAGTRLAEAEGLEAHRRSIAIRLAGDDS